MKKKMVMLLLVSTMIAGAYGCSSTAKESTGAATETTVATETTAAAITDSSAASADSSDLPDDLNELFQMENDIFAEHNTLWEKVFASMDKATPPAADDYASFLAATIDAIKEELSEEDLATLNADVEQIRKIEDKMTEIQSTDSDTLFGSGISAGEKFPAFEGTDFDGNAISDSIFSEHAVTLVNFWFNECSPCVEELPTLNELNKTLQEKGGTLIGINTEVFDNNEEAIATAKDLLATQGASYTNLILSSDSEAGKYASGIMSFPTTLIIDRNGNIVGDPIIGNLNGGDNLQNLMDRIDAVIAADQK